MHGIDRQQIQQEMVENALDFLESAATQISSKPKFSILHLATAIEVVLKAAIVSEHWSLLVKQQPSALSFSTGDFVSINTREIFRILADVLGRPLSQKAIASFSTLFDHRNQIVHFYNKELSNSERITKETISSSYYIDKFISESRDIFDPISVSKLQRALNNIRSHNEFLNTKFTDLTPHLASLKSVPGKLLNCNYCKMLANEVEDPTIPASYSECHVCGASDIILLVECPHDDCGLPVKFYVSNGLQILECGAKHEISTQDIHDALHTYPTLSIPHCAECGGLRVVATTDKFSICCECFEVSERLVCCEYCGETQLSHSSLDDSGWSGCAFCSGRSTWE